MKNNMKKFLALLLAVLMTAALAGTAFADDTSGLSGDGTGNVSSTKSLYYKVTQEKVYTDISGVKLEWEVPVLKYVDKDIRTWDTASLKWVQSAEKENTADVSFTLTNRGSYPVKANVSFTKDSALEDATVTVTYGEEIDDPNSTSDPKAKITVNGNDPVLGSIVNADETRTLKVAQGEMTAEAFAEAKSTYVDGNCRAKIVGKVTADLSGDGVGASGKLGTYTVKISDPSKQEPAVTTYTVTVEWYNAQKQYQSTKYTFNENTEVSISVNGRSITIGDNDPITTNDYDNDGRSFTWWIGPVNEGENDVIEGTISLTVTSDIKIYPQY